MANVLSAIYVTSMKTEIQHIVDRIYARMDTADLLRG
jgi:hypothetical protein